MFKRKQESLKSGDYCNPSLLPFKEGTKTINVICWSLSQSSRFVGNLEVPHGVIKHSDIIPWPGAFPHTCTLINPGSWTKLDFIPLSQLRTLGSTFSSCVFQSSLLLDVAFLINEPKPLRSQNVYLKKAVPKAKIVQVYITEINLCLPAPYLAEGIPIYYELSLLIRIRGLA